MGNEFDNTSSKRDKLQDMNIIQIKLESHDTYRKDGKKQQTLSLVMTQMLKTKVF